MKSGRELDALVAEKVMGFEIANYTGERHKGVPVIRVNDLSKAVLAAKPYSTDISAAFEVVEKMNHVVLTGGSGEWEAQMWSDNEEFSARSNTAPHAICLAALKACGVEVKQ